MEMCKYCKSMQLESRNNGPHVGLYCSVCGGFQKWIKQEHNIETGEIASEQQQKYAYKLMKDAISNGIALTKRQAGAIIQALKDKVS